VPFEQGDGEPAFGQGVAVVAPVMPPPITAMDFMSKVFQDVVGWQSAAHHARLRTPPLSLT
jgi:hypothetical protein